MDSNDLFRWQNNVYNDILYEINNSKPTIILQGNSGIGKTFIAQKILNHLQSNQSTLDIPLCLYFSGNDGYKFTDYYVFRTKFNDELTQNNITKSELMKGLFREGLKGIPIAGNAISWLYESLDNKLLKHTSSLLDSHGNEIMEVLENKVGKEKSLIIFDDINTFDQSSLSLLKHLILGSLNDNFCFLEKVTLLLIINDEYDDGFIKWLNDYCKEYKKLEVPLPKLKDIKSILVSFDCKNIDSIDSNVIQFIYSISGGNIELIKQIVLLLNSTNTSFDSVLNINNKNTDKHILYRILESRLKLMGANGALVDEILSIASLIGITFDLKELEFITEISKDKIKPVIKSSNEANLTENIKDTAYKFTHHIIKLIFQYRIRSSKSEYYAKIEKCLQFMRPNEYFLRAEYIFESGNLEYSIQIYLLGYFQSLRNNINVSNSIHSRIEFLLDTFSLRHYYNQMVKAYNLYNNHDFSSCINSLLAIDDTLPHSLIMEKEYLLAIASKKLYTLNTELNYSLQRLKYIFKNHQYPETEIWGRCASCLMAIYYDCYHDSNGAYEVYKTLTYFYSNRKHIDPMADYNINILNRKSKIFKVNQLAIHDTKKSVEYFKRTSYLSQYYRSLCNHLGNLITMGRYSEAFKYVNGELDFFSNFRGLGVTTYYYITNNIIISGVYSGETSFESGINLYETLLGSNIQSDDLFIIKNNLSVLLALSGQLDKAKSNFKSMIKDHRVKTDDYFEYFISMNLASTLYLLNEKNQAIYILDTYKNKIPFICNDEKSLLIRRQEYLRFLFESNEIINLEDFDTYLIKKYPLTIYEGWSHWGRGFLVSDIQFWSES